MTIPHTVRIAALVVATTAFYGYVGQMVPQKEVQPPAEIVLRTDLTTADMVKVGGEIMAGKGLCFTCHTIGKSGALRFPDLEGVDARAKTREPGLSDEEILCVIAYLQTLGGTPTVTLQTTHRHYGGAGAPAATPAPAAAPA